MRAPERQLEPLHELNDYTVAAGDTDPRGWDVVANDGRRIGRVDDLVVDTNAMKARYLDVKVDGSLGPAANAERHVLVPAAAVQIGDTERSEKRIRVDTTPEFVARTATATAPTAEALNSYDEQWPVVGAGACEVRIIRGGQHG